MERVIQELYIYPVKSLAGISVPSIDLDRTGLKYDRKFMLTDAAGRFMTRRENARLTRFGTSVSGDHLVVYLKERPSDQLIVPLEPELGEAFDVDIWNDRCIAHAVSAEADAFFSDHLNTHVKFVFMPPTTNRLIDTRYTSGGEVTSFTDGYQILLAGTASLNDLNEKLKISGLDGVGWERFRPNVVVATTEPFEEDQWSRFRMGAFDFRGVKLCSRCVMTTMDEATGRASKEPLKTLATYRTKDQHVYFGQNVISAQSSGHIRVGDQVVI
jgi:uncharacterized protein YcbX